MTATSPTRMAITTVRYPTIRKPAAPTSCPSRRALTGSTAVNGNISAAPLFVNQAGRPHPCLDFVGPSFVVDPSGRVVAETRDREEQIVFADVGGATRTIA